MARQSYKKKSFGYQIELVGKLPLSSSGPRGIDVYTRLLSVALSSKLPLGSLTVSKTGKAESKADLIHYTFFDPYFLTLWGHLPKKPFIVTVHDLIPIRYPTHFPSGLRGKVKWYLQKRALQQASMVITDSFASKRDIIKFGSIPPDKVEVIHLAAGHTTVTSALKNTISAEYNLPDRFILYVGDINWNKNVVGLIEAYSQAAPNGTHLVLIGKAFVTAQNTVEYQQIIEAVERSARRKQIHFLGFVPGHHLSAFYRLATLYVQPSWYEGFGLPTLEALNQKTPVLSSNAGSLPEVGGQVVHYFDPNIKGDLATKLSELLSNKALRTKYQDESPNWVKQFSWNHVADKTKAVYEKVLSG